MNTKTLSSALWSFLQDILGKINTYKSSGKMPLSGRVYMKTRIDQFSYEKGSIRSTSQNEYITKVEWDWADKNDFITQLLTENANYKYITSQIYKHYTVSEAQADFWLRRLIDTITAKEEGFSDETVIDYITIFIADLEENPVNWRIEIWIRGFWVSDNTPIDVNNEIAIRQITARDMEEEKPLDVLPFANVHGIHPSAIVEIHRRFKDHSEVYDYIETLINALRLFRLGSVGSIKMTMMVDSIIKFGGTTSSPLTGTPYQYELQATDTESLNSITSLIFSKNKFAKIFDSQPDVSNSIGIALKRYNSALLKSDTDEERIAFVVSCLEALFLKSSERSELSHRLSQRVAMLLKNFDLKPKKVYEDLDRAYLIRSIYSHGSFVNPEEHKDIPALTCRVLEYSRLSLLAFIQLIGKTEKENLINKLENAMIEENALGALKELIKENCKHYK